MFIKNVVKDDIPGIIEPEKLIYHGEFRDLFCSIYLEKSKLIEIIIISTINHSM